MKQVVLLVALLFTSTCFAQEVEAPVYGPPTRIVERLLYPETFEVVDWDGDGYLDVLAAGNGNNRLALFRGDSLGGYGWMELLPESVMADDWNDFRTVDWNGDGLLDLVACEEGGLVWLERMEDGELSAATLLRSGDNPIKMAIEDVNGDGVLDIAYCDSGSNEAVFLLGLGGGLIDTPVVEPLNSATAVALADWNADGQLDWIYSSYSSGQLYVRLGNGQGSFGASELVADFGKLSAIGVHFNAEDGTSDIFLGVDDTYVIQWHPSTSSADTLGLLAKAQQFDFGDLNGDGLIDVAVAAQTSGECGVIFASPEGGFDPMIVELEVHQTTDVAIAEADGEVRLFTNSRTRGQVGYRTFDSPTQQWPYVPLVEGIQYVRNLATGDVNNDGLDDVVVMVQGTNLYNGGPEYMYVALAQPNGSFTVKYVPTGTYFGYEMQLADYDGDNDLDAIVSDYNGDRIVGLRNDGTGTFTLADTLISSINGSDDVAMVDVDQDGDLDLIAAAWQGSDVMVALNIGNGQFDVPVELDGTGSRCEAVVASDFNGDGHVDVAAAFENSGDVRIWLNQGGGQPTVFQAPQILTLVSAQDLQGGDFDGDGDVDLFGVGYNETDVLVFVNNEGVFEAGMALGMGEVTGALMLTASDPDEDGLADIITSEYGGARFRLRHGATGTVLLLDQGNGPQNAAFGDFDGDGDQDVAMAYYSTGEIRWVELTSGMQPPPCFGSNEILAFLALYGCEGESGDANICGGYDFNQNGLVDVFDLIELLRFVHTNCDQ